MVIFHPARLAETRCNSPPPVGELESLHSKGSFTINNFNSIPFSKQTQMHSDTSKGRDSTLGSQIMTSNLGVIQLTGTNKSA